jgi:hypothetical protein
MEGIKIKTHMDIYNSLARPPREALREIQAGKLKGKTDINPQWRYKAMTEAFGLAGLGWKYEVQKLWTEPGAGNEKLAFAQVAVFVKKDKDEWSEPIVGIGGSKLVAIEKGGAVSNDEGYKMAVTDAFSTALKMIGVAADIYAGMWDGSKYKDEAQGAPQAMYVNNCKEPMNQQLPGRPQVPQQRQAPAPQQQTATWTKEQVQELGEILKTTYPNGAPVFTDKDREICNTYYKNGIDFVSSIKQIKEMRDLRLKEAMQQQAPQQPSQQPAPQQEPQADDLSIF